jgi:hypothetical protein
LVEVVVVELAHPLVVLLVVEVREEFFSITV